MRQHGAAFDWVPLLIGALRATLRGRQALVLENLLLRSNSPSLCALAPDRGLR